MTWFLLCGFLWDSRASHQTENLVRLKSVNKTPRYSHDREEYQFRPRSMSLRTHDHNIPIDGPCHLGKTSPSCQESTSYTSDWARQKQLSLGSSPPHNIYKVPVNKEKMCMSYFIKNHLRASVLLSYKTIGESFLFGRFSCRISALTSSLGLRFPCSCLVCHWGCHWLLIAQHILPLWLRSWGYSVVCKILTV